MTCGHFKRDKLTGFWGYAMACDVIAKVIRFVTISEALNKWYSQLFINRLWHLSQISRSKVPWKEFQEQRSKC